MEARWLATLPKSLPAACATPRNTVSTGRVEPKRALQSKPSSVSNKPQLVQQSMPLQQATQQPRPQAAMQQQPPNKPSAQSPAIPKSKVHSREHHTDDYNITLDFWQTRWAHALVDIDVNRRFTRSKCSAKSAKSAKSAGSRSSTATKPVVQFESPLVEEGSLQFKRDWATGPSYATFNESYGKPCLRSEDPVSFYYPRRGLEIFRNTMKKAALCADSSRVEQNRGSGESKYGKYEKSSFQYSTGLTQIW